MPRAAPLAFRRRRADGTDGRVRQGSKGLVPAYRPRTPRAWMEPSLDRVADACRVVP